jgi:signal transduction histidine kinase
MGSPPTLAGPAGPDSQQVADDRLVLLDRLRQAERLAVSSRVASVIAHLIGTPLNVIAGRAALIRANPTEESTLENARRIEEQVERLAQRIRRLIEYLTAPDVAVEPRAIVLVLDDAMSLYRPIALRRNVSLEVPDAPLPDDRIDGTSGLIVLTSLLSLAVRAAAPGDTVRIGVSAAENGVTMEIGVPGMDPPQMRIDKLEPPDHLWRGSVDALQVLSVCHAIAARGGGRLEVEPLEPSGSLLKLFCRSA